MALKRFVFLTLILPLALFLLGCLPVSAQESKSEKKQAVHPDAAAVQRLLQLADDSSITNLKQALIYAKEALHTAGEKKYLKGQADAYLRVADLTIAIGNSDSISTLCQRAMELYQHLKDPEGVAACQATRGYYAYLHGNLAEARKYYLPSRQYYQSVKDPKGLARLQNEFGLLHWTEGNYPAALTCFQQAILIYERINDRKSYSYAENNLGLIYLDLRQDSLALRHFHRSLAMDQARGDEIGISLAYGNIGEAYQHLKKDSLALYYFQQSLTLSRAPGKSGRYCLLP